MQRSLLSTIRAHAAADGKPLPSAADEDDGDDDMAFLLDRDVAHVTIKNDVVILNEDSAKQRLAISYAVAQSAILSIFEGRVEAKMEAYRYERKKDRACAQTLLTSLSLSLSLSLSSHRK